MKEKKKKSPVSVIEKRDRYGWLFILPFLIGFLFFTLTPLIQSFRLSFYHIQLTPEGYDLVPKGLEYYNRIFFVDPTYRTKIGTSLKSMSLDVPMTVLFSFFAAILLNQKFKGRTFARAIFFLPVIFLSSKILNLNVDWLMQVAGSGGGLEGGGGDAQSAVMTVSESLRTFFYSMGLPQQFMSYVIGGVDRVYSIVSLSGVQILLFLAALQTITPSLMEAAKVEGANGWECFWKITLPMVSSILLVGTVYTIIDSFTSNSNPIVVAIAQESRNLKYGLASAMSWFYYLVIALVLGIVYWLLSKLVFYYD